jgi:hypothetical protein
LDADNDSIADDDDCLIGEVEDVQEEGCSSVVVKVNGSTNLTREINGTQAVGVYDDSDLIMNFTHNFSAGKIYLDRVSVVKGTNFIVINLSGQLIAGETKVIYIDDNDFIGLCVKDAEIGSVGEISSSCEGVGEYDFTGCLGNSTGYVNGSITCYDEGSRIRIENLSYSGILGSVATVGDDNADSPSGGSSNCIYDEDYDWNCSEWSECVRGIQERICKRWNNCGSIWGKPEIEKNCSVGDDQILNKSEEEKVPKNNEKGFEEEKEFSFYGFLSWKYIRVSGIVLLGILIILFILRFFPKKVKKKVKTIKYSDWKKRQKKKVLMGPTLKDNSSLHSKIKKHIKSFKRRKR